MFTPLQPFELQQIATACYSGVAQILVSEEFEKLRQFVEHVPPTEIIYACCYAHRDALCL
jgi:hypothetical protein